MNGCERCECDRCAPLKREVGLLLSKQELPKRFPKPYYPDGYGFWKSTILSMESAFQSPDSDMKDLLSYLDIDQIKHKIDSMLEFFKTTEEDFVNHMLETRPELTEVNIDELMTYDKETIFWMNIGCRKSPEAVEKFKSDIASAIVNTIVNGMEYRLDMTTTLNTSAKMEVIDKLDAFITLAEENFKITWMD